MTPFFLVSMASSERSENVFQQFQTLFNKQTALNVEIEKQVEEERKRRIFYEEKCERLEKELNHLNTQVIQSDIGSDGIQYRTDRNLPKIR